MTDPASRPPRVAVARWSSDPPRFSIVLDGEPFGPLLDEDAACLIARWLEQTIDYLESPPKDRREGRSIAALYDLFRDLSGATPGGKLRSDTTTHGGGVTVVAGRPVPRPPKPPPDPPGRPSDA